MKNYMMFLSLLLLTGCSNNSELKLRVEELELENHQLVTQLEKNSINQVYTYKDEMDLEVVVLEKLQITDETKYYIVVTQLDVDHNTPLVVAVPEYEAFDKFVVGEKTRIKVYTIVVIEDNHKRFEFLLME